MFSPAAVNILHDETSRVTLSKFISEVVVTMGSVKILNLYIYIYINLYKVPRCKDNLLLIFFSKKIIHEGSGPVYQTNVLSGVRIHGLVPRICSCNTVRLPHWPSSDTSTWEVTANPLDGSDMTVDTYYSTASDLGGKTHCNSDPQVCKSH